MTFATFNLITILAFFAIMITFTICIVKGSLDCNPKLKGIGLSFLVFMPIYIGSVIIVSSYMF
jgi:hypothetical protein